MTGAPKSSFIFVGSRIKKFTFTNPFIHRPVNAKNSVEVDYVVDDVTKDENGHIGIITLYVKMKLKSKKSTSSLALELEGCFELSDESASDDAFSDMLQLNGTTMLYSIARSIIQTVTSQSYLDESVALPMLNVISLYEMKKQAKDKT